MAIITNAVVVVDQNGQSVLSDCFGNNAAIECPKCRNYPVLLIARDSQRGSNENNPSICRHCGAKVSIVNENLRENEVINVLRIRY